MLKQFLQVRGAPSWQMRLPPSSLGTPHQARQAARRLEPDAHHQAAQSGQHIEPVNNDAARSLKRNEAREQRAIEEVDADGAREDVEPPRIHVTLQHLLAARIVAATERVCDAVGKRGGIPEPEIETLRADRRQDVSSLSDQGDTPRGESLCGQTGDGKRATRSDTLDLTKKAIEPPGERVGKALVVTFQ